MIIQQNGHDTQDNDALLALYNRAVSSHVESVDRVDSDGISDRYLLGILRDRGRDCFIDTDVHANIVAIIEYYIAHGILPITDIYYSSRCGDISYTLARTATISIHPDHLGETIIRAFATLLWDRPFIPDRIAFHALLRKTIAKHPQYTGIEIDTASVTVTDRLEQQTIIATVLNVDGTLSLAPVDHPPVHTGPITTIYKSTEQLPRDKNVGIYYRFPVKFINTENSTITFGFAYPHKVDFVRSITARGDDRYSVTGSWYFESEDCDPIRLITARGYIFHNHHSTTGQEAELVGTVEMVTDLDTVPVVENVCHHLPGITLMQTVSIGGPNPFIQAECVYRTDVIEYCITAGIIDEPDPTDITYLSIITYSLDRHNLQILSTNKTIIDDTDSHWKQFGITHDELSDRMALTVQSFSRKWHMIKLFPRLFAGVIPFTTSELAPDRPCA